MRSFLKRWWRPYDPQAYAILALLVDRFGTDGVLEVPDCVLTKYAHAIIVFKRLEGTPDALLILRSKI